MNQRRRPGRRAEYRSRTAPRPAAQRTFTAEEGFLEGARKDVQSVGPDWLPAQKAIEGVRVTEVRNVNKGQGVLTEIFRADWRLDDGVVAHVFQVWLAPGEVSAWHAISVRATASSQAAERSGSCSTTHARPRPPTAS